MYSPAIGFSPSSVLAGLSKKASPFARGQAMASAAGLGLDAAQKNQEFGVKQMRDESQLRQQQSQNAAQQSEYESRQRMQAGDMQNRAAVFDTNSNFDYRALQKRKQLQWQQSLLNGLARSL